MEKNKIDIQKHMSTTIGAEIVRMICSPQPET
jgi:hypothetical protein